MALHTSKNKPKIKVSKLRILILGVLFIVLFLYEYNNYYPAGQLFSLSAFLLFILLALITFIAVVALTMWDFVFKDETIIETKHFVCEDLIKNGSTMQLSSWSKGDQKPSGKTNIYLINYDESSRKFILRENILDESNPVWITNKGNDVIVSKTPLPNVEQGQRWIQSIIHTGNFQRVLDKLNEIKQKEIYFPCEHKLPNMDEFMCYYSKNNVAKRKMD